MTYGWAKRDGVELGGRTVTYDANGNRISSCGGMRTANAGNSSVSKAQDKSDSVEERIRKNEKKKKRWKLVWMKSVEKKRNLRNDWKRCVKKERCIWSILLKETAV